MKVSISRFGIVDGAKFTAKKIALPAVLLITVVSGCGSVAKNSENYYADIPREPINWREYLTD